MRNIFFLLTVILYCSTLHVDAEVESVEVAKPVRISIPSIHVTAPIYSSHLTHNGEMEITDETTEVAWFADGANPGQAGNAVLAGHVDGYTGPAIFFHLRRVQQGDFIYIVDENKTTHVFTVIAKETFPYNDTSPVQKIFGPTKKKRLNLITCTGQFNRTIQSHMERLVVYTELVYSTN